MFLRTAVLRKLFDFRFSYKHCNFSRVCLFAPSETQGQSVGLGGKAGRKFSSMGKRATGYRLSLNYFQKFKRMPPPDWAQEMPCIIVPNRRTVSPEFFFREFVHEGYCLAKLAWFVHHTCACKENFYFQLS